MDSDAALDPDRTETKPKKPRRGVRLGTAIACLAVAVITAAATFGGLPNQRAITAAAACVGAIILVLDRIVDSWEHGTQPGGLEIGGLFMAFGGFVIALAPRNEFALASVVMVVAMAAGAAFTFAGPLTKWLSPLIRRQVFVPQNSTARFDERKH
jgi:hypothetical protein